MRFSPLLSALSLIAACHADPPCGPPYAGGCEGGAAAVADHLTGDACAADADCAPADYCDALISGTCQPRGGDTDTDPCPEAYAGTATPCYGGHMCGACIWPEACSSPFACLTFPGDYCSADPCGMPECAPYFEACADGGAP